MTRQRIFDTHYHEVLRLKDGTEVSLSILGPEHRGALAEGFEGLSRESRFRRFLSVKSSLSEQELSYYTEVDGETHFALAAGHRREDGKVEPLGTARFVRCAEDPAEAELALAVVDDWQGRGLGRALLTRLLAAAEERGIERLLGTVMATNSPMIHLMGTAPGAHLRWQGGFVEAVLELGRQERIPTRGRGVNAPTHSAVAASISPPKG